VKNGGRIDFAAEAMERLDTVHGILDLGREPRIGEINELFRAVHSLKGLAGLAGYTHFSAALHEAENLLDSIRLSKLVWSKSVREALNEFIAVFEGSLARAGERGTDAGFDDAEAVRLLARAREPEAVASVLPLSGDLNLPEHTLSCLSKYEESRLRVSLSAGLAIYTVDVAFELDRFEEGLKSLGAALNEKGEWIATLPQASGFTAERLAVQLLAAASAQPSGLAPDVVVTRVSRDRPVVPEGETLKSPAARTVRLDAKRLDELLSEAEEARGAFLKLDQAVARLEADLPPSQRVELTRLRQRVDFALSRLTREASWAKTVPLSHLADRLQRAADRILSASGKKATFQVLGGQLSIDRSLAEDLADPLLQIVRNAIDHGLELPQDRKAAGKPEEGKVTLLARSRGSRLVLSVADDGRGIDEAAVLDRARGLGWLREDEVPPPEEIHRFLFRPGFSTASSVSEISGRGVGLDLVLERVESRHGEVRVMSEAGKGSRFEIEIPVSQAVFDALIVAEGEREFAFPLATISRVVRDQGKASESISLARAVGLESGGADGPRFDVVLNDASAISVGRVVRQELLVVRPVETSGSVPFLIGASEGLRDEAILVFDPKRLIRSVREAAEVH
jgi:two-component system chemotaxis sensor kinase CheA